jgi:phosphoribosyl-AMP cyclohydrolase
MKLKLDSQGLIPAIIQDARSKEVLMLGYMNPTSLKRTLKEGKTCFYSRSRQKYWIKGETSGHIQIVKKVMIDCDLDTVLILVEQRGGACHTGYRTCFYTGLDSKGKPKLLKLKKVFDPKAIYKK